MTLDRRTTLKALCAAGAAPALAGSAAASSLAPPVAVLYSSRYPESRAFAAGLGASVLRIDTARRDIGLAWRAEIAKALAARPGRIEGFGPWSDRMISEIMGRDLGLRLVHEARAKDASGEPTLFHWSLA